ncbi:MAG: phosphate-starvation-inducible PsiE family protein [Gammaproteobacteria bacterium]|jgi:phosphate starvation-inducible membrane PsiE|nr:phosphate-starvation-inducible PsiE family protein [Gammaproteobacteria bacterium]
METLQISNDKSGKLWKLSNRLGNLLVDGFHYVALFAIGAAIVWSAVFAFIEMTEKGHVAIDDILVLFIYLEFGAMVGIYFKTNHMPVRFLVYVAMTALTRMLIADMPVDHKPGIGIVYITGSILLLAVANLVVRYSSAKYPGAGPAAEEAARGRADSK